MWVTSAPPTTAPQSFMSNAKAARTAASPSRPNCSVSSTAYRRSRAIRFPGAVKQKHIAVASGLSQWPARNPLFVGRDGERISRGTLQSRIKRAFKRAGPDDHRHVGAREPALLGFSSVRLPSGWQTLRQSNAGISRHAVGLRILAGLDAR